MGLLWQVMLIPEVCEVQVKELEAGMVTDLLLDLRNGPGQQGLRTQVSDSGSEESLSFTAAAKYTTR